MQPTHFKYIETYTGIYILDMFLRYGKPVVYFVYVMHIKHLFIFIKLVLGTLF